MSAAEAGTRSNDRPAAPSWPPSYYHLIAEKGSGRYGDVLAVCTVHPEQPHVRYVCPDGESWCQALPPRRRPFPPAEAAPTAAAPIVVQLDAAELGRAVADGVVVGFRQAREEQRAERRQ